MRFAEERATCLCNSSVLEVAHISTPAILEACRMTYPGDQAELQWEIDL